MPWTLILNENGPRIEPCGVTDSIFSHELQKEFIFPLSFVSVVCYGRVTCSKVIFLCLTVSVKEIAGIDFRNLYKPLKGEKVFLKSSSCKGGK